MSIYENKGPLFPVNICVLVCECADSAQVHTCASAGLVWRKRKITAAFIWRVVKKPYFTWPEGGTGAFQKQDSTASALQRFYGV